MPTPRSESIAKAYNSETFIREPRTKNDIEHDIDRYAVLSQVINSGIEEYIDNPYYQRAINRTRSLRHLDATIRENVKEVIIANLTDNTFAEHHQSLVRSVTARKDHNESVWSTITENLQAGIGTFVSSFSDVFDILNSRLGTEIATSPNNWTLFDRIAKLNIDAFSAYTKTFLIVHENRSEFIDQIEVSPQGGVKFKTGYPANATVTVGSVSRYSAILGKKDLLLDESNPTIKLKDIEVSRETIGCPITFYPDTIKNLWSIYAEQANRILSTPAVSSAGDTEASHQ